MDKKSKILLVVLFVLVALSGIFLYYQYVIKNDFAIIRNDDGVPILEDSEA